MAATLELENLEVRLAGRLILDGLSGCLKSRAIGLLGPNGSGKTTLINTLLGFHGISRGNARVLGHDVRHSGNVLRRLVGYMPENESLIVNLPGVRFVRYMAELSGLPPRAALERAHEAFFYVGLGEVRYRKLGTYSLGMKQLAKLAQAIVHGPQLLILDEPTNGMDPPARQRMIQLIRDIRETSDTALILSSHLLRDVEETCEEVLILKGGHVAGICNLEEDRRSNRKFIDMETVNSSPAFVQSLEQMGCECAVFSEGHLKIVMPQQVEIRELYAVAERQQVQIRRMNHRRDSLNDIFLKAMGAGVQPAAPTTPATVEVAHG